MLAHYAETDDIGDCGVKPLKIGSSERTQYRKALESLETLHRNMMTQLTLESKSDSSS